MEECYGTLGSGCSGNWYCEGNYMCDEVRFKGPGCKGYRLPTESEWEYAARAGSSTAIYTGELTIKGERNGPELDSDAWYGGNSGVDYGGGFDCFGWKDKARSSTHCGTHSVGKKNSNQWSMYDALGNVWEWTWDYYKDYPLDGVAGSIRTSRVFRGGGWYGTARYCRSAGRFRGAPINRTAIVGFRLVRSL